MDISWDRQKATDPVVRPACLVPGCSSNTPVSSPRRVAFFTAWRQDTGQTADRVVEPDPDAAADPRRSVHGPIRA